MTGSYKIETIQPHIFTIEKAENLDTVSIDRVFIAQRKDVHDPSRTQEVNGKINDDQVGQD